MSISQQASNGTPHSSRRRRRGGGMGGPINSASPARNPGIRSGSIATENSSGGGGGVGGGRGHSRRTLWEDKDKMGRLQTTSQSSSSANMTLGNNKESSVFAAIENDLASRHQNTPQSSKNASVSSSISNSGGNDSSGTTGRNGATGGHGVTGRGSSSSGSGVAGSRRGGGKGRNGSGRGGGSSGSGGRGVHPAMLESEFLAATGQTDAQMDGPGASLSLEEVPYDRDLRWCNTASDSRPCPTMDVSGGVFGRVGAPITLDTGDYERLDRHYQLWKDRDEPGAGSSARGRGGRAGRGGRCSRAGRGAAGRLSTAASRGGTTTGRGDGAANRGDGGGPAVVRGGGGGGGGQSRSPPLNSTGRQPAGGSPSQASRGGGEKRVPGVSTAGGVEAGGAGGGVGVRGRSKRNQRACRGGGMGGRSAGGGGGVGGVPGLSGSSGIQASAAHRSNGSGGDVPQQHHHGFRGGGPQQAQQQQHQPQARNRNGRNGAGFSPQSLPSTAVVVAGGVASAQARGNRGQQRQGRHWEGGDTSAAGGGGVGVGVVTANSRFVVGSDLGGDPWASSPVVRGSSLSPPQRATASPLPISVSATTPPLIPSLPSLLPAFPTSDTQYLGDLASSSIGFDHSMPPTPQPPPPAAVAAAVGVRPLGGHGTITPPAQQQSHGIGGGVTRGSPVLFASRPNTMMTTSLLQELRGGGDEEQRVIGGDTPITTTIATSAIGQANISSVVSGVSCSSFSAEFPSPPRYSMEVTTKDAAALLIVGTPPPSAYSTPRRSPRPAAADLSMLTDPALDVDIQDICVDADLNANAPVFVPGGYFPG